MDKKQEVMDWISTANYNECIKLLNDSRVAGLPKDLLDAVVDRARSLNGMTLELVCAAMQNTFSK